MRRITTAGLVLAKNVFQVHGVNEHGKVVLRKQLKRDQVAAFFANLPPCLVGRVQHEFVTNFASISAPTSSRGCPGSY